jgi:hypothetical protein
MYQKEFLAFLFSLRFAEREEKEKKKKRRLFQQEKLPRRSFRAARKKEGGEKLVTEERRRRREGARKKSTAAKSPPAAKFMVETCSLGAEKVSSLFARGGVGSGGFSPFPPPVSFPPSRFSLFGRGKPSGASKEREGREPLQSDAKGMPKEGQNSRNKCALGRRRGERRAKGGRRELVRRQGDAIKRSLSFLSPSQKATRDRKKSEKKRRRKRRTPVGGRRRRC